VSPLVKYTLARIGLFVVVAAVLLAIPFELNLFLKLAIALLISAGLAVFLLRGMRDDLTNQLASAADRRKAEKARLRAALAGAEAETPADATPEADRTDAYRTKADSTKAETPEAETPEAETPEAETPEAGDDDAEEKEADGKGSDAP
jgi:hypothetical protein